MHRSLKTPWALALALCAIIVSHAPAGANEMQAEAQLDVGRGSDLLVYDPATGQVIKSLHSPGGGYNNIASQVAPGQDTYLGRLNDDNLDDVLFVNPLTGLGTSAINTQQAGFDTSQTVALPLASLVVLVDFNGDRRHDVLTYQPATGAYQQWMNNGTGTFSQVNAGFWTPGYTTMLLAEFNEDTSGDLFGYNATTGAWSKKITNPGGIGFTLQPGAWFPGAMVYPGRFNDDNRTDFLAYNPVTGQMVRAACDGVGGFAQFVAAWLPGWSVLVFNQNADNIGDVFLYNALTGAWLLGTNQGAGPFAFLAGNTSAGLVIRRINPNADALSDLLAYNIVTGALIEAINGPSGFSISQLAGLAGLRILTMAAGFFAPGPPPFGPPFGSPPDHSAVVFQVSAANPGLVGTCAHDNNTFLFEVLRALRQIDRRYGLNWKRGNTGDLSEDIVDYYRPAGGDEREAEGSTDVWLFDVVSGCGSSGATPGWIDQTGPTEAAGTVGRWTLPAGL